MPIGESIKVIEPLEGVREIKLTIETNHGIIHARLFADKAPLTVANFVNLADDGYYDGLIFHRIIPGFMIQGGCPDGSGRGGPGYSFNDEFHPELRHTKAGMFSMANAGPNTNGSQFFITLGPTPHLDNRHAVFGEVLAGYEVCETIASQPKDHQDQPHNRCVIERMTAERVTD